MKQIKKKQKSYVNSYIIYLVETALGRGINFSG